MMLWLLDKLTDIRQGIREGTVYLGPLVITTDERLTRAQKDFFEMGLEVGARGWRAPEKPRHLHSV